MISRLKQRLIALGFTEGVATLVMWQTAIVIAVVLAILVKLLIYGR